MYLLCQCNLRNSEGKWYECPEEDKVTHSFRVLANFLPSRIKDFQMYERAS